MTRLLPGQTHVLSYKVQFLMRGYYQIGPLLAETGDVFGLHRRFRVITEPNFALVMPKVLYRTRLQNRSRQPIEEIPAGPPAPDPDAHCGESGLSTRRSLNRIHWRASARTGRWQNRQCGNRAWPGPRF